MTFVSHAPHSEDVLLWRALWDKPPGLYVEVAAGGMDATPAGLVTQAFSERGWQGICLVGDSLERQRLQAARPRDLCLELPAGDAQAGPSLGELFERHARREVHFLALDAGGEEAALLEGLDLRVHRPWIMLVRAVQPGTREPSRGWDPDLRAAGYHFVWFDGQTRFYVAEEHDDALGRHFRAPPNRFDAFRRAGDGETAGLLVQMEARVAELEAGRAAAEARARLATQRLAELRLREAEQAGEMMALKAALATARGQAEASGQERLAQRLAQQGAPPATTRRAVSWRVGAPMRHLMRRIVGDGATIEPSVATGTAPAPGGPNDAPAPAPAPVPAVPPPALPPVLSVHQFHAGTASAGVSSRMLLIRRLLRAQGYASEIFCGAIAPDAHGVWGAELPAPPETLPAHGRFALILHWSAELSATMASRLPATGRVLMVHGLGQEDPHGNTALAALAPHVSACLTVSEAEAVAVRMLGFALTRSCPLLWDVDARRAAEAPPPATAASTHAPKPFTVLFAGGFADGHAIGALMAAFARFRAQYRRPSRLVLADCGVVAPGFRTDELRLLAQALELGADVEISEGPASPAACCPGADLFVSLSQDDGIAGALIEAMAAGVPVLAWPAGALAELLGPDGAGDGADLLTVRDPAAVAAQILDYAEDDTRRGNLIRRQLRGLDRLRPARHLPVLLHALALAGAAPPEPPDRAQRLAANLQLLLVGPLGGNGGIGTTNRALALALETARPGRVRLAAPPTRSELAGLPAVQQDMLRTLGGRPAGGGGPLVALCHPPALVPAPGEAAFATPGCDAVLAMLPGSTASIGLDRVRQLNGHVHGVLAPTAFATKALVDSGVWRPVYRLPPTPDLSAFRRLGARRPGWGQRRDGRLTFLHVSSCDRRKGVDVLLAAYARAFRRADPVRLVIKSYPHPQNTTAARLAALRAETPSMPEVVLIHHDLESAAFLDLYRDADVMVLPSRGEGFSHTALEAMAAGLALVISDFGGHRELCDASTARLIATRLITAQLADEAAGQPDPAAARTPGAIWAEPSEDDLLAAMLECYTALAEDRSPQARAVKARIRAAAARVDALADQVSLADGVAAAAIDCLTRPASLPPILAWITPWTASAPGAEIAHELRALLRHWPANGLTGAHLVLADAGSAALPPPGPHGGLGAEPQLRIAWRQGDADNVPRLSRALAREDPAIVVIQHHPDLLGWGELAHLLASPALAGRTVAVVLHEPLALADLGTAERLPVLEALGGVSRVIVADPGGLAWLHEAGLGPQAVLVPRGMAVPPVPVAVRALPADAVPVIACVGQFLPAEGVGSFIAAAALLRGTWPQLKLRLIRHGEITRESAAGVADAAEAARAAGLDPAVEWHVDGTEADAAQALVGCDLVVLPWQSPRAGSAATLRAALGAGAPVAASLLPAAMPGAQAVTRIGSADPVSIAEAVRRLLRDAVLREEAAWRARDWAMAHAWPDIAERLQGMLVGLTNEDRRTPSTE